MIAKDARAGFRGAQHALPVQRTREPRHRPLPSGGRTV